MAILNWASLILTTVSMVLTGYFGWKAGRIAQRISAHVEVRVIDILLARLQARTLRDASQVRGIVQNVADEYEVATLTEKHLEAVLRRIALKLENDSKDHSFELSILESIRKEIAPKGPPLMSIALTDRMLAFQLIMFTVALVDVLIFLWSFRLPRLPHGIVMISAVVLAAGLGTVSARIAQESSQAAQRMAEQARTPQLPEKTQWPKG